MIKKIGNKFYTVIAEGLHKVTLEPVYLLKDEETGKEFHWYQDEKILCSLDD